MTFNSCNSIISASISDCCKNSPIISLNMSTNCVANKRHGHEIGFSRESTRWEKNTDQTADESRLITGSVTNSLISVHFNHMISAICYQYYIVWPISPRCVIVIFLFTVSIRCIYIVNARYLEPSQRLFIGLWNARFNLSYLNSRPTFSFI